MWSGFGNGAGGHFGTRRSRTSSRRLVARGCPPPRHRGAAATAPLDAFFYSLVLPCPTALWPLRHSVAAIATKGEQAWHRRARRRRQTDRALVALAAARRRLAAHHGGGGVARAAMPQRRAAGSDSDAGFRDRLFAFLERERRDGDGGSHGRAGRGGSRGRDPSARGAGGRSTAAEPRQPRQGDWRCKCGFSPNFGHRRTCFSCGKPRGDAAAAGGTRGTGSLLGPIGAGGLRPQLAWGKAKPAAAAARDDAPSYRVPGASVAARASATQLTGAQRTAALGAAVASKPPTSGKAKVAGAAASPAGGSGSDDEGFHTVPPRGNSRRKAGGGGGAGVAEGDAGDDDAMGDADGATTREPAAEGTDGAGGEGDGDVEDAPTPAQLRRRWQEEVAVVKHLGLQGLPADHPAMEAACQARDSAERAWREAKDPTPLAVRLSRAQAKVDRAVALQADTRAAMQKLEAEYKAQLAVLEAKLAEDQDRVQLRRRQLEEVQAEAGAGTGGGSGVHREGMAAARRVHSTMCNEMAPAVAALVEQVDSGSPAWQMLNSLLCQLATSQHELQQAFEPQAPGGQQQHSQQQQQRRQPCEYDIGDGRSQDQRADGEDSVWSESHDLHGQVGTGDGNDEWGPWSYPPRDAEGDQPMGSGEWWDEPRWRTKSRWHPNGYGQWTRSSWADQWEEEYQCDDGAEQGAAKHRRTQEPAPAPASAAAETADASGATTDGDPEAAAAARLRHYNERVAAIIARAIELGIQPLTDEGEDLQLLSPGQLDAWVAAKLPFG